MTVPLHERGPEPTFGDWIWSKCGKNTLVACIMICIIGFVCGLSFGVGVDWFLASVLGITIVLLFFVNTYLVVMWSDPQDASTSVWQMLLVITALSLAEGAILGLPLDVANGSNTLDCSNRYAKSSAPGSSAGCGNLNMTTFWEVLICCIVAYVVVLLPMAIFQYEAYDEVEVMGKRTDNYKALISSCYWEMGVLVVVGLTLGLMYAFLGTAEVPVATLYMDVGTWDHSGNSGHVFQSVWPKQAVSYADVGTALGFELFTATAAGFDLSTGGSCTAPDCTSADGSTVVSIRTSFAIYMAALTGWVGWFIFVIFGGIGLASLPGDLLQKYVHRPVVKTETQLAGEQKLMQGRTNELLRLGGELKKDREEWYGGALSSGARKSWREKSKRRASDRQNVNKFKQMVFVLETDFEQWEACKGQRMEYNPLYPYFCLAGGAVSAGLSLLWILHVCLYVLIPEQGRFTLFLNFYFMQFDNWFPLFGILSVALFSGYLLCCVISGIFKVGVRCFCMNLHPMRYGKTLMNSWMFNTMWIMLCAIPVVQFSTEAFDTYARYTAIGTLLGVQVKYLKFFTLFFVDNVFVYCLLAIFVLSVVGLGYKPKDEAHSSSALKKKLSADKKKRGK